MSARHLGAASALLVLLPILPFTAVAQQAKGIRDGTALGGEVAHLWVDDGPNTELTLIAFRLSTLRQRRVGFDLEAALAAGSAVSTSPWARTITSRSPVRACCWVLE